MSLYPYCFQEFLFIFRSLTILCQCIYPFVLITLAVSWVSQICILMLFIIFGKYFGHYYFKYLFLPFLSLFPFSSSITHMLVFLMVSHRCWRSVHFLQFYFLFFRKLDNFYWFIKFTDSSSDIWNLVLSPSRTFFNYRTFQLQNLFLFKIISIVRLILLIWRVIIVIFYLII